VSPRPVAISLHFIAGSTDPPLVVTSLGVLVDLVPVAVPVAVPVVVAFDAVVPFMFTVMIPPPIAIGCVTVALVVFIAPIA